MNVEIGTRVAAGDALASIEAMKMEHEIRASVDGIVSAIHVKPGQQVEAGTVLVVVDNVLVEGEP